MEPNFRYEEMTVQEVLSKVESAVDDTPHSYAIYNVEEGAEDSKIVKMLNSSKKRRDWIVIAELYNESRVNNGITQKFHLTNYLRFKIESEPGIGNKNFVRTCYAYIRNAALIFYIREVVFEESDLDSIYKEVLNLASRASTPNKFSVVAKK